MSRELFDVGFCLSAMSQVLAALVPDAFHMAELGSGDWAACDAIPVPFFAQPGDALLISVRGSEPGISISGPLGPERNALSFVLKRK